MVYPSGTKVVDGVKVVEGAKPDGIGGT